MDADNALAKFSDRLRTMTDSEFKKLAREKIADLHLRLHETAIILVESERRGIYIPGIPARILPALRLLGCGRLVPEAKSVVLGAPYLAKHLAQLPFDEQKRLSSDDATVTLVGLGPKGERTDRKVLVRDLDPFSATQVFDDDKGQLRSPPDQLRKLHESRQPTSPMRPFEIAGGQFISYGPFCCTLSQIELAIKKHRKTK